MAGWTLLRYSSCLAALSLRCSAADAHEGIAVQSGVAARKQAISVCCPGIEELDREGDTHLQENVDWKEEAEKKRELDAEYVWFSVALVKFQTCKC